MKNRRFILMMVLMAFSLSSLYAQYHRKEHTIDVGLGVGLGFYNGYGYGGQRDAYNVDGWIKDGFLLKDPSKFGPVNEMFGASIAYRIDSHWAIQLQGFRQRMLFNDHNPIEYSTNNTFSGGKWYYSCMWNVDAMGEYYFFDDIVEVRRPSFLRKKSANLNPYVGLGIGCSLFDSIASPRWLEGGESGKAYPMIKNIAVGPYVVIGAGAKWHITGRWQLKAAVNYQLHFGRDRRGTTFEITEVASKLGHNVTLSLGALYAVDIDAMTSGRNSYRYNWRKSRMKWSEASSPSKNKFKSGRKYSSKKSTRKWLE